MELGLSNTLLAGDPRLVDHIVGEVKSQGIFDQFRKECIADVDTKPAYQNLRTRVEGSVNSFLGKQPWKPDLNKNQLRETLRKHIHEAPYLDAGVERIVDQVVNPKVYSVFMPQIEDVVYKFLGIERPKTKEKNGACGLKDLLPKDLDPVSPESDKNSLKDVSLESVDTIEDLKTKNDEKLYNDRKSQEGESANEKYKGNNSENGQFSLEEKVFDDTNKLFNKTGSNLNLNTSGKSDDKTEEDEEDSPTFEPIDIMNLNESNISNDSHLSGISELTSHRSRSPDFCNELSRDNFDYSNQDSQLSKVSSDTRLSIVTDLGSSNYASTPIHEVMKEEVNKDKCDVKNAKDNFKAVREFESNKTKSGKSIFELNKSKDIQDIKESKSIKNNLSFKENSRDALDSAVKDKYEHKNSKDKTRDTESKSKSKEKNHLKEDKHHRDKSSDKKKQKSHSSVKYDKYDKTKSKDKCDHAKENVEKVKDIDNSKDISNKLKEEKGTETDKKDSSNKEAKDLKDLYKEKIRELREKKELTEKEKLNKDNKDIKPSKENRDKKDSPKDKKSYKKDHKSSTSKNSSLNSHETKNNKTSEKLIDGKDRKNDSKDKSKRDEKRSAKDDRPRNFKTDSEKSEKQDIKKISKGDKEEKTEKCEMKKDVRSSSDKTNGKKDVKNHSQNKSSSRSEKGDSKRDTKSELQVKDKKRRDDKKTKSKDDHSSLRKNSNDRRSTDRDGSNGSSSKSSQSSNSSSNIINSKSNASNLSKETSHVSNSSSETSDSIEEAHINGLKLSLEQSNYEFDKGSRKIYNEQKADESSNDELCTKKIELGSIETNLPLKKRPLLSENNSSLSNEVKVKKPKFAKNIHEAKKLMKIRKQIEKQKFREHKKPEKKLTPKVEQPTQSNISGNTDNFERVPDEERVQIIEIPDEEYEEPYPEKQTNLTLEERSRIMLETEPGTKTLLQSHSNLKLNLSDMELCIRQSLCETIPSKQTEETVVKNMNSDVQTDFSDNENKQTTQNIHTPSTIVEAVIGSTGIEPETKEEESAVEERVEVENSQNKMNVCKEDQEISRDSHPLDTVKIKEDKTIEHPLSTEKVSISTKDSLTSEETLPELKSTKSTEENSDHDVSETAIKDVNTPIVKDDVMAIESTSTTTDDNEDCRYFKTDNEKTEKFSNFLESLELVENASLEDIIECLGGQVVSSVPEAMAPPLPKRKHSSSPLTDILFNNSNNNNNGHKKELSLGNEDALNNIKKRKLVPSKKQRPQANFCTPQGLLNGENFVMPLSPESDVSATSEKIPSSNLIKEDKSRHRSSQRYSSDDLYKPRPLFSSSSRRSRRSNQA